MFLPGIECLTSSLRSLLRKESVERELDEEVSTYLEMATKERMKKGMSREDARRAVRLELGTVEATKEIVRTAGWEFVAETWWRDIRYGLQRLRKQPAFTGLAVLTLALGAGATTAIFSVIYSVLLDPFPYLNADRVAVVQIQDVTVARPGGRTAFALPEVMIPYTVTGGAGPLVQRRSSRLSWDLRPGCVLLLSIRRAACRRARSDAGSIDTHNRQDQDRSL